MGAHQYERRTATLTAEQRDDQVFVRLVWNGATHEMFADAATVVAETATWQVLIDALAKMEVEYLGRIDRLAIEVLSGELAALDWESIAPGGVSVVRTSPVRPRVARIGLTFPLRFVEVDGNEIRKVVEGVFWRGYPDYAIHVDETDFFDVRSFLEQSDRPTAEVLHFHHSLFRNARDVLRLVASWQTRLVVFESDPAGRPFLRWLAQQIIDRGGPAVWIFERGRVPYHIYELIIHDRPLDWIRADAGGALFAGSGREELLRYSLLGEILASKSSIQKLISDLGLKESDVVTEVTPYEPPYAPHEPIAPMPSYAIDYEVYFDAVEPVPMFEIDQPAPPLIDETELHDAIATELDNLAIPHDKLTVDLTDMSPVRSSRLDDRIAAVMARKGVVTKPLGSVIASQGEKIQISELGEQYLQAAARIGTKDAKKNLALRVKEFAPLVKVLEFHDQERRGMLPLATKVDAVRAIRSASATTGALDWPVGRRSVNAAFYIDSAGVMLKLSQSKSRVIPGAIVHLGISIGKNDVEVITFDAADFLEEKIEWDEETNGAWIEIGVTGIDFEVVGSPVQEVWLPRTREMNSIVMFAVKPVHQTTIRGAARLRFSIFHQNNLVQSFLMAAVLNDAVNPDAALASALDIPEERAKGLGYMMRNEYSTVAVNQASTVDPRALTIIANNSAGEKVVTFKGDDLFDVKKSNLLPDKVRAARDALAKASADASGDYRYLFGGVANAGNPDQLLDSLFDIAEAGWNVFSFFVPKQERQHEVRELLRDARGIHAAHIDLSDVIPWSLIYDREVDRKQKKYEDVTDSNAKVWDVKRGLCPAGLADMSRTECGTDANCLLLPATLAAEKAAAGPIFCEESVICPRRFWGFTQPIEVPVQQVSAATQESPPGLKKTIETVKPAEVMAGFNEHLELTKNHRPKISTLVATNGAGKLVTPVVQERDAIQQLLGRETPAIVYIYCHAYTEATDGTTKIGPNLSFGSNATIADGLVASQLTGPVWKYHPLVFLNGCGTVGFSPSAPSEFITQFVQGREASAVIGTEVTVWEALADDMASEFLRAFLIDNKSAGEALLLARRRLLAKNNPLGLVYTLYGNANLVVKWA